MVTHVLAPTDFIDESRKAVECALELAKHFKAKLTIVHLLAADADTSVPRAQDSEKTRRARDQAESMLRRLEEIVGQRYPNTESYLLTGRPCPQIVAAAKSPHQDVVLQTIKSGVKAATDMHALLVHAFPSLIRTRFSGYAGAKPSGTKISTVRSGAAR